MADTDDLSYKAAMTAVVVTSSASVIVTRKRRKERVTSGSGQCVANGTYTSFSWPHFASLTPAITGHSVCIQRSFRETDFLSL